MNAVTKVCNPDSLPSAGCFFMDWENNMRKLYAQWFQSTTCCLGSQPSHRPRAGKKYKKHLQC